MGCERVFIFYSVRNSGHHSAARALGKAFGIADGDVDVSVMNLAAYTNPIIERLVSNLFVQVMKRRPAIWGRLYNSPRNEELFVQFADFAYRRGVDKVGTLVEEHSPDAIICTQCIPCNIVDEYKRATGARVPLVAVVTDFFIPYYWICQKVDLYIVPDEESVGAMVKFGVPREKVKPLGIPVDPDYARAVDGGAVRARLGLDADRPVILVMGGGSGIGPLQEVAMLFMNGGDDVQVIVVAGRNNALKQRLSKEKEKSRAKHVTVLSYEKRLNELMEVSDLIISKPGGLTLAETMAKGLPIIAISPLPGQEERNMDYLADRGAGYRAGDPTEAVGMARDLLVDRERLASLRRKSLGRGKPTSAIDAATAVINIIDV